MIDKIVHQIWWGSKTIPDVYHKSLQSIKEVLPDYEYKFWDSDNISELTDVMHIVNHCNYSHEVANFLRFELVRRYGGIYLDIDMIVHKSLNPLIDVKRFTAKESKQHFNFAIFGAEKNDYELEIASSKIGDAILYHTWDLKNKRLWRYITECVFDYSKWHIYPTKYFYPYLWNENPNNSFMAQCYTEHVWSQSWRDLKPKRTK